MNSNMEKYLIIGVAIVYAFIAIGQLFKGSVPNAIVWSGYAFSNIGLYMLAK